MTKPHQTDIAYHRAKYPTRCMLCALPIGRGALIVTVVDDERISLEKKSKARWAHPECMKRQLQSRDLLSRERARQAWRQRVRRRTKMTGEQE